MRDQPAAAPVVGNTTLQVLNNSRPFRRLKQLTSTEAGHRLAVGLLALLIGSMAADARGAGVGLGPVASLAVSLGFTTAFIGVPLVLVHKLVPALASVALADGLTTAAWVLIVTATGVDDAAILTKWWMATAAGVILVITVVAVQGRRSSIPLTEPKESSHGRGAIVLHVLKVVGWLTVATVTALILAAVADAGRDWTYLRHKALQFRAPPGLREVGRVEMGEAWCPMRCTDPTVRIYFQSETPFAQGLGDARAAVRAQFGAPASSCRYECVALTWRRTFTTGLRRDESGLVVVGTEDSACASRYRQTAQLPSGTVIWVDFTHSVYDKRSPGYSGLDQCARL
jgi:hypothetical protein